MYSVSQILHNKAPFLSSTCFVCELAVTDGYQSPNFRAVIVVSFLCCNPQDSLNHLLYIQNQVGQLLQKIWHQKHLVWFIVSVLLIVYCNDTEACPDYLLPQTPPPCRMEIPSPILPLQLDQQTKWDTLPLGRAFITIRMLARKCLCIKLMDCCSCNDSDLMWMNLVCFKELGAT